MQIRCVGTMVTHTVCRDVSERGRSAAALRDREALYRTLVEMSPDGISVADLDGRITMLNGPGVRMLGLEHEREALGKSWLDFVAPEERTEAGPRLRASLTAAASRFVAHDIVRADGSRFRAEVRATLLRDEHGQPAGGMGVIRDLSDRLRAETEIRRSRDLADTILNAMDDEICIVDVDTFRVVDANQAFVAARARPAGETIGRTCHELTHGSPRPCEDAHGGCPIHEMLRTGRHARAEHLHVGPAGEPRHVSITVSPLRDALGRVTWAVHVARDITLHKRGESARQSAEASVRAMLDNFPYLAWLKDTAGRFVAVNQPFAAACGLGRAQDVLGKTDLDVWPRELAERYRTDDAEVMRTGARKLAEEPIDAADGIKWFETFKAPIFDDGGRLLGTTGFSRDITERMRAGEALKESEARLRALLRAIPDMMFRIRRDGTFLDYHATDERTLLVPGTVIIGQRVADLLPGDAAAAHLAHVGHVLESGEPRQYDYSLVTGGERRVFEARMVKSGADEVLAIIRDVTEKMRLDRERGELQQQFQQAQKMEAVGQLAGGVAHDFNNLLSVILSFSGFALDELPENSPLRADLLEIKQAGQRAAGLTRQLLAFSRKQVIEPRDLLVDEAVGELATMLERLIGENILLEVRRGAGAGLVTVDPTQFDQILTNLAVNARDAMPGGGRLTIATADATLDAEYARAHPDAEPGAYVVVTVADTGTGIPADVLPRIFEPFFTTKEKGKGTGLGLSMVYGAMRQNGGHVAVESQVGVGTTFRLYFKKAKAPARQPDPGAAAVERRGRGETILVVEDEPAVRATLVRMLTGAGYTVLEAALGVDALATYQARGAGIALVIADVVMPGMSGPVLGVELARLNPDVKVLYCSGYTDEMLDLQGAIPAGRRLIAKPIDRAVLLATVRELLGAPRG